MQSASIPPLAIIPNKKAGDEGVDYAAEVATKFEKLVVEKEFKEEFDAPPHTAGEDYDDPFIRIMARHWVRANAENL